jgi:hypothetical protein
VEEEDRDNRVIDLNAAGPIIGNISLPIKSIISGISGITLTITPNRSVPDDSSVSVWSPPLPSKFQFKHVPHQDNPPETVVLRPSGRVLAIKRGFRSIRTSQDMRSEF